MESQSFLQILKEVFEQLKKGGLVTQEEIDNGFKISVSWLESKGISKEVLIETLRNLHRNTDRRIKNYPRRI